MCEGRRIGRSEVGSLEVRPAAALPAATVSPGPFSAMLRRGVSPAREETSEVRNSHSAVGRFLRLWLVLFFSYALLKVLFNLLLWGWIDLRPTALYELLFLPLGQTVVLWVVIRGWR